MKNLFVVNDIGFMLKVWERARANGKKAGDSVQAEFEDMIKENPDAVMSIGTINDDIDILTGNLRESGVKVLNLNEIERLNKSKE